VKASKYTDAQKAFIIKQGEEATPLLQGGSRLFS
jgi:hypothetical protein